MAASNATGRGSGAPVYIEEPGFSRWLFGSSTTAWMENGKALKGCAAGAIAASKDPEHPQVAYSWWVSFLHWVSDNAVWMAKLARLTPQEERILGLVSEGGANKQIGEELGLAEKTVKNYVSSILTKLEVTRRAEAAAYLARHTTPGT
jgi:DNA-binding NarL/FixJ family response regulator